MDHTHPVSTPTPGSKSTNHFAGGLAPVFSQAMTEGDGPKFRSLLDKDLDSTTSSKSFASRKL